MIASLDWQHDGADWPNRESSRFVDVAGIRWHVQSMGHGPVALLVHGTGSSTHSWRALAPLLAEHFTVVALDLPGHAFTAAPSFERLSLPGMAQALAALLSSERLECAVAVGHSAGAAILARMCLDGDIAPRVLISLNGALLPLGGLAGQIFAPLANLVVRIPAVPWMFARMAGSTAATERLIAETGSVIDPAGIEFYRRLVGNADHAAAVAAMMANWDLRDLARELPRLKPPPVLVVGSNDRTIAPADAYRVKSLLPSATVIRLSRLGHLAHEERPLDVARIVFDAARIAGILADS